MHYEFQFLFGTEKNERRLNEPRWLWISFKTERKTSGWEELIFFFVIVVAVWEFLDSLKFYFYSPLPLCCFLQRHTLNLISRFFRVSLKNDFEGKEEEFREHRAREEERSRTRTKRMRKGTSKTSTKNEFLSKEPIRVRFISCMFWLVCCCWIRCG